MESSKKSLGQKGFSLVELSIVLVVIGLIVGGITAGVSIVKGSKLKSVITDYQNFKTAMFNFKNQYDALPGDMLNAHSYFDDGADGVCGTAADCNGDGDHLIEWNSGPTANESFRAWQHLSLAGLVPGNFTGIGYGSGNQSDIGVNVPASKVAGGGYTLRYINMYSGLLKKNFFEFGSFSTNSVTRKAIVTARDAANLDKKIDDGQPQKGSVHSLKGQGISGTKCISGTAAPDATYLLSETDVNCRIRFLYK